MSEKVMLITGATSGIGKATALRAAAKNYKLILTARRKSLLDDLVSTIGESRAFAVEADATDYSQQKEVIKAGVEHWGKLDVAFANAGMGVNASGTENGDPKEWDRLIDINVKGLLWTANLALPHLRKTQGHFIITSSAAGRATLKGSVYGASKWFAYGYGKNLAEEMAEWGGRCTTICPGMVNTDFFDEPKPDKLDPNDVAEAVLYATEANPRNSIREVFLMPTN
ncbi:SDR family oxidoreductase [Aestuariibacter sp. AA17]|uniref:SDR family oxidoreductase n=1 Tax=Fluctibacter corallii TaxID=2984329 RepID=A0ABT3ADF1_9ALTE|nr:SDR family oxidoreductase [Aestuariibacter sp. AA17]MCV2886342.1 SDR family oxidoreductase [Aestuariibacter sp. AA17]